MRELPAGCIAFDVEDPMCMPHIRRGESAVVDTTDRDPQHGEVYLIRWNSGRESVMQAIARRHTGIDGEDVIGWWTRLLAAAQFTPQMRRELTESDDTLLASVGLTLSYLDGPRREDRFRNSIMGRVVGVLLPEDAP